jgi:hypothetical protein
MYLSFYIQVNYLVQGIYGTKQSEFCLLYTHEHGWYINISYLDLRLDSLDFVALFQAIKKKVKNEIVPEEFRQPPSPPNILIEIDTSIDWKEKVRLAARKVDKV